MKTILNPAPAVQIGDDMSPMCDYMTPNENEAALLTGVEINPVDDAERAADVLLQRGVRNAVIT